MRLRIGFLASHGGSALAAILEAIHSGRLDAAPVVVVSNNGTAGALALAHAAGVPALHLSRATHPEPAALDRAIRDTLGDYAANLVVLSGYMKKIGPLTLDRFQGRILNTPALLPKFGGKGMYGIHVHQAVLASGDPVSGATIHVVDEHYDHGPVVSRQEVPVLVGDLPEALQQRVKTAEAELFVWTLMEIATGRLPVGGDGRSEPRGSGW